MHKDVIVLRFLRLRSNRDFPLVATEIINSFDYLRIENWLEMSGFLLDYLMFLVQ